MRLCLATSPIFLCPAPTRPGHLLGLQNNITILVHITNVVGDYAISMHLTGLLKKTGNYYVALCLELNVASQGESIEEARKMLHDACEEYLAYIKEQKLEHEIQPVTPEVLRDFLLEEVEQVRPAQDWAYSETIAFEVSAGA